jgi:hypothetical protein
MIARLLMDLRSVLLKRKLYGATRLSDSSVSGIRIGGRGRLTRNNGGAGAVRSGGTEEEASPAGASQSRLGFEDFSPPAIEEVGGGEADCGLGRMR